MTRPWHVIVFRDANRKNIVLENLELISRAELARRNHPKNKSPELFRLIQLKGAIARQVNRIAREAKEKQS
ncbi:HNH endonuclease [Cupriavidus sp. H39]|uniref:HNH endonuclease n=1 Tax=Cupriavidus sp. H39 TaxID=3401635 RepID=UPI003D013C1C